MPNPKKNKWYRLLEIIPGASIWITFVVAIYLSIVHPIWAVYLIIIIDLYWLIKVLYWLIFLFASFIKYRQNIRIDWYQKVQKLKQCKNIFHIVFLPTYKEEFEVIDSTFEALSRAHYALNKMIIVLAIEEKDKERGLKIADAIQKKYTSYFYHILITIHPSNLDGEVQGKGSNMHWAGLCAKEWLDTNLREIPYNNIIASAFDIDTRVHPQYFSYLTHTFLTHPNPTKTSYQPVALFHNNAWDSTTLARVTANSTTFWLLAELSRPERMFTFSSHSMSFQALVDAGFWQPDIVTEDSRIFLQCYLAYNGHYSITPLFMPVSMDAVHTGSFWSTIIGLYKQQRRWAWGIEHFPFLVYQFSKNKKISLFKKIFHLFNLMEGMYSWATAPILIFVLGRLPFWFGNEQFQTTALRQSAPLILHWLLSSAMIGMFFVGMLSLIILPPRPRTQHKFKYAIMALQWILIPITMILFGSLPAIDAQTRLMLGKYLSFSVTKKVRAQTKKMPSPTMAS